jgi:predicted esterase/tetratricopeptide (TPR) repeat protein
MLAWLSLATLAGARPAPPVAAAIPTYLGGLAPGSWTGPIPTLSDPTQSWELYLPANYAPARKWPVLILFDPRSRGRAAGEIFRAAADELGWILASSNNTMSDGPAEPNARAINAMIPDVMKRLPIDEKRIYAGGFSGGAVLAWTVGLKGNYLAGVISVGGRPAPEHLALTPKFALFSTAGEADFNFQPTRELDAIAAQAGVPHRLEFFPGPHSWCPPETARAAVLWLEILAMRDGRTPRDISRIEAALGDEMSAAEALAVAGDALAAGRRFTQIGETFLGLGPQETLNRAARRARELLSSSAAKSSVKEEKAAEKYESQMFRRVGEAAARLRAAESPVAVGELRHLLGTEEAERRRDAGGILGAAAVRALAAIQVQLGFYLAQELFAARDYRRAVPGLQLATELDPDNSFLLYNLACAQARSGLPEGALASLERALDLGLAQPTQLATDADLATLRDRPEFARLLARARELEAAGATAPAAP